MSVFDVGLPFSVAGLGTDEDIAVWEAAGGTRVPVLSRSLLDVRTTAVPIELPPNSPSPPARRVAPVVTAVPKPVDGSDQEVLVDLSPALSPRGIGFVRLSVEPGQEAARAAADTVVVRPRGHRTTTVVQVTNIGVTARGNGGGVVVLATRLDTAAPIPDALVTVYSESRAVVWQGRTDADGLAVARPRDRSARLDSGASILVVKDGDAAFLPTEHWPPGGGSWLVGTVTTDRGVCRPGERVEVKAWLRLATPNGLVPLVPGSEVTLIWSSDEETKQVLTSTVGTAGGATWSLQLPDDAKVDADERLAVMRAGDDSQRLTDGFAIKAVRPAEFQVTLGAALSASVATPTVEARVQARDLSGVALATAPVEWRVTRQPYAPLPPALQADREFHYDSFDDDTEEALRQAGVGPVHERSGRLDAEGEAAERILLPAGLRGRGTFAVAAQVRDTSSQVQGQTATLFVPPDAYLGIGQADPAPDTAGIVTPALRIAARTAEGAVVAGIAVTLRVRRESQDDEEAVALQATTGDSPVRVALPAAFANGEEIVATARAANSSIAIMPGRFVGPAVPRLDGEIAETPMLTLDRATYRPGDRVRVTIASPVPGVTVLLTLERGGVAGARVVRLDGTTTTVDVPIGDSAAAGLRLVGTLIQGRRSPCCGAARDDPGRPVTRSDGVDIVLDQSATKLDVAIEAPARARPGGRVPVRVRVRDAANRPVSGEVTLWAVDEGWLALSDYRAVDPQRKMYQADGPWVWGHDTRRLLLGRKLPPWLGNQVQTSTAAASFARSIPPGPPPLPSAAADGPPGADMAARRDFRPLAFWHAAIATDADGVAAIEATLPDTLTTYRIMAIAADPDARFGSAGAALTVAKPVMTRPAVPRTLTRSDRASIRATVAASAVSGAGTVVLESLTPALLAPSTGPQAIRVDDGGRVVTAFDVEARGEGLARIRIIATIGGERDVVERTIAIVNRSVLEVSASVGAAAPDAIETVHVPAGVEVNTGSLDLELASTMLVGLKAASRYVVQYPYECAEQMASRALALILQSVLDANGAAPPPGGHGGVPVREVLAALESYRCPGGYGYWQGRCEGKSPYLAAYILFVRQTAAQHGHAVDAASLGRDAAELEVLLAETPPPSAGIGDDAWRAFAAKVLADGGRRPAAAVGALYSRRDRLPIFALAHLLDAQATLDPASPRVVELRRQIRNALTVGATAHVEERQSSLVFWCWPSNVKSTAIVLDVLSRRGGLAAEEAGPLVRWLLGARRSGIWSGTQENVWALASLAAYRRAFEAAGGGDVTATATLARTELLRGTLTLRQPTTSTRLSMPALLPITAAGGAGRLAIRSAGAPVYYATRLELWRPARDAAPVEHGIAVHRRYVPVVRGQDGADATTFQAGDLVRVLVTVRLPESRTFLALTDPLPGGFDAVDTTLATAAPDAEAAGDSAHPWWANRFDRIERYDDRVDLFATSLPAGEHTVSYLARATTPGTFFAAGPRAEAMYEPEVAGRAAGVIVTVTP